jgi:hypothetical protein
VDKQLRRLPILYGPLPAPQPKARHEARRTMRTIVKKLQRLQDARIDVMYQCTIEIEEYDGRCRWFRVQSDISQADPEFAAF